MNTIVDWDQDTSQWSEICAAAAGCGAGAEPSGNGLWPIYGPLLRIPRDQSFVIAQIGQSLDGRVATPTGRSHYINGKAALVHLHRFRALVDAIVVGVGTVIADDPQLNVRLAQGPAGKSPPARVVLDPNGRIPAEARCLRDDGARRILVRGDAISGDSRHPDSGVEQMTLPMTAGGMAPHAVLAALGALGLRRILVEGGANTVSRFLAAGCLHRLHVMVAPLIIGSGPPGVQLAPIDRLEGALRPTVTTFPLPGGDVLFDCEFAATA